MSDSQTAAPHAGQTETTPAAEPTAAPASNGGDPAMTLSRSASVAAEQRELLGRVAADVDLAGVGVLVAEPQRDLADVAGGA